MGEARVLGYTLGRRTSISGVGVHSGARGVVTLEPAAPGTGWVLEQVGRGVAPLTISHAIAAPGSTAIRQGNVLARTPEHLCAALLGLWITDVRIRLEGPEFPILDGSSRPWVEMLLGAGVEELEPSAYFMVRREVVVRHGPGVHASMQPADCREVSVEVAYDRPWYPSGTASYDLDDDEFEARVAWARTFVLERDVVRMRQQGLGRGANDSNTLVYSVTGPRNPERVRGEAVSHKLLDAIGDLGLLGLPLIGRVHVQRGGHALHQELLRKALSEPGALERIES